MSALNQDNSEAPQSEIDKAGLMRNGARNTDANKTRKLEDQPSGHRPVSRLTLIFGIILVAALLAIGAYGHWRTNREADETQKATIDYVPTVRAAEAKLVDEPVDLILPGQTEAFQTAAIYARATGYISERSVDIGSRVKKGDSLVRIASPELDEQLAQAKAQLGQIEASFAQAQAQVEQAKANVALATTNTERSSALTQKGFETVQNLQTQQTNTATQQASLTTAQAGVKVAEANLRAQQAAVDRLTALSAFENVTAPFDGVVTARNIEVGDLVNADSASSRAIFTIDEDDQLRIAVRIPQYSSEGVRTGIEATVTAAEIPDSKFVAKVARTSVALLFASRTLTAEVDVPNADGVLRPGMFVDVAFKIPRPAPIVEAPAEALIFNQRGMQVAVVANGEVKLHKIDIYRDLGKTVEIRSGLKGGEKIIINPPIDLDDGSKVNVGKPNSDDLNKTSQGKSDSQ